MPRRIIQRYMPNHHHIRNHRHLRHFGILLHNPDLWHLNRHSVAGSFFIGLFTAFIPLPFQMVIAAALAIAFHVNLPIAVALVWITNPLTMPALFFFAYKVGTWIMGVSLAGDFTFELSLRWFIDGMDAVWQPFLVGCTTVGLISGIIGFIAIKLLWRAYVSYRWRRRDRIAAAKS